MTNPSAALCDRMQAAALRHAAASARFDHEVGAQAGVTLSTWEANFVNLLRLHGPLSPGQLGRLAGVSSSGTITGVIDRLEQVGYVTRTRSRDDRRRVTVSLNTAWLEREDAPRLKRLRALLADYDEAQLTTIAEFLTRLADVETEAADAVA
ncbi:MarR family winged helix-turn-helix transcriptional regulator [Streptomyces sp. NPDC057307]|uniref:MarR family winged helix-turn-helix transcriptional regulator n=1 Tax=Streptomyces sp. NPDC057307 TaxID=3346096 RepID=UPI003624EA04